MMLFMYMMETHISLINSAPTAGISSPGDYLHFLAMLEELVCEILSRPAKIEHFMLAFYLFQMLIYFFSDRDYNLAGFNASFSTSACPFDCSRVGTCNSKVCSCNSGYYGEYCQHVSINYTFKLLP